MMGIVVFSYGFPNEITANKTLSEIAVAHAKRLEILILTQREVTIPGAQYVDQYHGQGAHPTLRVARKAVMWAHILKMDYLWVVAMPPHMWRCLRDLKYAIEESGFDIKIRSIDQALEIPYEKWFSGDSQQWYTKTATRWYTRETLLKLMPMRLYTMIAS
jgi:hypothetical protein